MSCGLTACVDFMDFPDADGNSFAISGYLQVAPEEFTREELQALLKKARDLLPWTSMAKFDLLEDLVAILDLLDALAAREDADLAGLDETIAEHFSL